MISVPSEYDAAKYAREEIARRWADTVAANPSFRGNAAVRWLFQRCDILAMQRHCIISAEQATLLLGEVTR